MAKGVEQVMVWIQDEMTVWRSVGIISSGLTNCIEINSKNGQTLHDQGLNPSSSWLGTHH